MTEDRERIQGHRFCSERQIIFATLTWLEEFDLLPLVYWLEGFVAEWTEMIPPRTLLLFFVPIGTPDISSCVCSWRTWLTVAHCIWLLVDFTIKWICFSPVCQLHIRWSVDDRAVQIVSGAAKHDPEPYTELLLRRHESWRNSLFHCLSSLTLNKM